MYIYIYIYIYIYLQFLLAMQGYTRLATGKRDANWEIQVPIRISLVQHAYTRTYIADWQKNAKKDSNRRMKLHTHTYIYIYTYLDKVCEKSKTQTIQEQSTVSRSIRCIQNITPKRYALCKKSTTRIYIYIYMFIFCIHIYISAYLHSTHTIRKHHVFEIIDAITAISLSCTYETMRPQGLHILTCTRKLFNSIHKKYQKITYFHVKTHDEKI